MTIEGSHARQHVDVVADEARWADGGQIRDLTEGDDRGRGEQKPRPPAGREGNEQEHGIELQHGSQAEPRPGATVMPSRGAAPAEQREGQDEKLELADIEEAPERRPRCEGEARSAGEPQPATDRQQQYEVERQPQRHDHRKGEQRERHAQERQHGRVWVGMREGVGRGREVASRQLADWREEVDPIAQRPGREILLLQVLVVRSRWQRAGEQRAERNARETRLREPDAAGHGRRAP